MSHEYITFVVYCILLYLYMLWLYLIYVIKMNCVFIVSIYYYSLKHKYSRRFVFDNQYYLPWSQCGSLCKWQFKCDWIQIGPPEHFRCLKDCSRRCCCLKIRNKKVSEKFSRAQLALALVLKGRTPPTEPCFTFLNLSLHHGEANDHNKLNKM